MNELTQSTTEGYTDAQLAALNAELALLLADIDPLDTEAIDRVCSAFADEVSQRSTNQHLTATATPTATATATDTPSATAQATALSSRSKTLIIR